MATKLPHIKIHMTPEQIAVLRFHFNGNLSSYIRDLIADDLRARRIEWPEKAGRRWNKVGKRSRTK